jgi:hypothetical protein
VATDEPVAYVNKDKDGRFSFYRADGSEVIVAEKPYETDDPKEIEYLDGVEVVERATAKSGGKE